MVFLVHTPVELEERLQFVCSRELTYVGKIYWKLLFHAIVWVFWLERNKRVFEGKERTSHQIECDIKEAIWNWALEDKEA